MAYLDPTDDPRHTWALGDVRKDSILVWDREPRYGGKLYFRVIHVTTKFVEAETIDTLPKWRSKFRRDTGRNCNRRHRFFVRYARNLVPTVEARSTKSRGE